MEKNRQDLINHMGWRVWLAEEVRDWRLKQEQNKEVKREATQFIEYKDDKLFREHLLIILNRIAERLERLEK